VARRLLACRRPAAILALAAMIGVSGLTIATGLAATQARAQNGQTQTSQAQTGQAQTSNVPLPKPSPVPKKNGGAAQAENPVRPPLSLSQPTPSAPPMPVRPNAAAAANGRLNGNITPAQRELAAKVSSYLSSLQNLFGNFVQVGPDGTRTTGQFFIQKPGKVRFEYDPPTPINIVADGSSMIVRDTKLATQDLYPLSQTPLRFLLSNTIDIVKDTSLVGLYADDVFITAIIEEKQPLIGTSRLMLMIGAKDLQLKQWTITDPQGFDTTVAVYNLDPAKKIDPGMFKIDYTDYNNNAR
jgi:outer membrane lipoprotein-sorting protein